MCGVIGIVGVQSTNYTQAASEILNALLSLQHRGQDAAGLAFVPVEQPRQIRLTKSLGLVEEVVRQVSIDDSLSLLGLGHTRYSTIGENSLDNAQPMMLNGASTMAMVHNGNLVNYHELAREWEARQESLNSRSDGELLLKLWRKAFDDSVGEHWTFERAIAATSKLMDRLDGAYAVAALIPEHGLIAFRDPNGIRPLVLGVKEDAQGLRHCVASESTALQVSGFEFVRAIQPGELIWIDLDGEIHTQICTGSPKIRGCMFEWVYFSAPESIQSEGSIYAKRLELGRRLAKATLQRMHSEGWSPDIVCPIPDTAKPAALGLAEALNLPYREAFIKNYDVQRSFILGSPVARETAVKAKMLPVVSEIQGRDILLVDDSLVRGTTSMQLVDLLKRHGAKSISLAVSCPPIRYPCLYGIDFPTSSELLAYNCSDQMVAEQIGVRFLVYQELDDLVDVLGDKLCTGCLDQRYPTKLCGHREFVYHRNESTG